MEILIIFLFGISFGIAMSNVFAILDVIRLRGATKERLVDLLLDVASVILTLHLLLTYMRIG